MVGSSEINQVIRICLAILEKIGIGDFTPFMIYIFFKLQTSMQTS